MPVLLTKKFVCEAWDANRNEAGDVYHHPTQSGIVHKCIDLSCHKPLTKMHLHGKTFKSSSPEKWLEAYIIQLAKRNSKYQVPFKLVDKTDNPADDFKIQINYRFLYSQLKFPETKECKARPLDCLFYNPATQNLVITELKTDRNQRKTAIEELDYYAKKILEAKDEFTSIFKLEKVANIEGYIVWPGNDEYQNKSLDFGGWGLIGYSAQGIVDRGKLTDPWKNIQTLGHTIKFTKYQGSKLIK